jgi:hypothetical protein
MRIVDLNSLRMAGREPLAFEWLSTSFVPMFTDTGMARVPGEAIYGFATTGGMDPVAERIGIQDSNVWAGDSIYLLLKKMLNGINQFRLLRDLSPWDKFLGKVPVTVLTDREFAAIESLGATPFPFEALGGH